jgi:hypothetical protein
MSNGRIIEEKLQKIKNSATSVLIAFFMSFFIADFRSEFKAFYPLGILQECEK